MTQSKAQWAQERLAEMLERAHCDQSPSSAHHWMLEARAINHEFKGVCKYCGEERLFPVEPREKLALLKR